MRQAGETIARGKVVGLASDSGHRFSKQLRRELRLIAGLGVEGDAHSGRTVQHRSRISRTPDAPNVRQVHIIHSELLDELARAGFCIGCGDMGENILSRGIDLLALPRGTRLEIGDAAVVELTGLRNPCHQLNKFAAGLMDAVLYRDSEGELVRKAGVMAVALAGGTVRCGDTIVCRLPDLHEPLQPV